MRARVEADVVAPDDETPKQTTPKGFEIPVPNRDGLLRDLAMVAPPVPKPPEREDD